MLIKVFCALFGFLIITLLAMFAWGELRYGSQPSSEISELTAAATLSEQLSDGLIEAQVYVLGDLAYRIEIQFSPDSTSNIPSTMPPELNLGMELVHMDGFDQPLEMVGNGEWQSQGKVPMAGMWILNVGYGDDFAEVHFAVE
jgi:hypothetical protein